MGLFNFFKGNGKGKSLSPDQAWNKPVAKEDKKFYQPDSYYTRASYEGTMMEKRVVTYPERKKTAVSSDRGLYPSEILLLEYCNKGIYPNPENGYPGFWWFEYGIRNVGVMLKTLEDRGFIILGSPEDSVNSLKVNEIKELLKSKGLNTTGKKAELVERIGGNITPSDVQIYGLQGKYRLTNLGYQEIMDNAYVGYMHNHKKKTIEDNSFGSNFNVWGVNNKLGSGDKPNWKNIVDRLEKEMDDEIRNRNRVFMENLEESDSEMYKVLDGKDKQLEAIKVARENYEQDNNLERYINFWEEIWNNGGLKFEGSKWHFELPDLYIKSKDYDSALRILKRIKNTKPNYSEKADKYSDRIKKLNEKESNKNK